ncbi:MAG: hemolysin family protein [Anaerolineae bacterium]
MTDVAAFVVIMAVLLATNALYVAAEFAAVAIRPSRLRQLAQEGHPIAQRLEPIVRSPAAVDEWMATAQVGNTVASLGLAMYGEEVMSAWIRPLLDLVPPGHRDIVAGAGAVLALTYVHVVLGETVPKGLAMALPERTVLGVGLPMLASGALFRPLVAPLGRMGQGVLALLGIPDPSLRERMLDAEELGTVISQSTEGGLLTEREGRMLLAIVDFGEHEVRHVMTPRTRIDALEADISPEELQRRLAESPHMRFPVYEGSIDRIIGVLYLKDYIAGHSRGSTPTSIRAWLRQPLMVPEHMDLERLLDVFRREHGHLAIVMDEYGGTAGLVTMEDVAEEIVGEIRDEFDFETPPLRVLGDGAVLCRGDLLVDDLAAVVDLPDERPEAATVGGLVTTLLGRPAGLGDEVRLGRAIMTVEQLDGLAVAAVRVTIGDSTAEAP